MKDDIRTVALKCNEWEQIIDRLELLADVNIHLVHGEHAKRVTKELIAKLRAQVKRSTGSVIIDVWKK